MAIRHDFDLIARDHGAMIRRIAASYEANPHLAEELVQEIHFALWRALPAFRGDASVRTFVARIATNRAITHVARALKSPPSLELNEQIPAPGDDPERKAIALSDQAHLMAAVRRLPLSHRQAVTLALEGLAPKEIADFLGLTPNAVAVRLSRAKDLLRNLIGATP
ncbi:MAG: sigma-70 family RNA polymerase sigma factor [Alphaproteobacteria bacterium]|nr:sigma-70 family RNA polymerase sigma factor [Alphaproteobacteria bacterium]